MALRRRRVRRIGVLGDQVLSGISNALAVVLVARVLEPADFGRFALAYAGMTFTLGLSRSYFGNRLVFAGDHTAVRAMTGRLLGAVVLVSPLMVAGVLLVSVLAVGTQALTLLLVVAVATPVVCLQDLVRVACASTGQPGTALVSDGAWVLIMVTALIQPLALDAITAVLVWAGGAVAATVLALLMAGVRPRLRTGRRELLRRHAQSESMVAGTAVATLASLLLLWLVAVLVDERSAGSLRGAATAMAPINVLFAFTAVGVTAALVRRDRQGDLRRCAAVGAALCSCVAVWGTLLLLVPPRYGTVAFGESWAGIRSVLPWTVVEYSLLTLVASAALGLKVRSANRTLLQVRLVQGVGTAVGAGLVAVLTGSAVAVAAALAVAAAVAAAWGWLSLLRSRAQGAAVAVDGGPVADLPAAATAPGGSAAMPSPLRRPSSSALESPAAVGAAPDRSGR